MLGPTSILSLTYFVVKICIFFLLNANEGC